MRESPAWKNGTALRDASEASLVFSLLQQAWLRPTLLTANTTRNAWSAEPELRAVVVLLLLTALYPQKNDPGRIPVTRSTSDSARRRWKLDEVRRTMLTTSLCCLPPRLQTAWRCSPIATSRRLRAQLICHWLHDVRQYTCSIRR